jgi:hypothetical protein
MIRVFDFRIEGSAESVKLASMSEGIAKRFTAQGQEMLNKGEQLPAQEWLDRRNKTILESMMRAGANGDLPTVEKLTDDYDSPTLTGMYLFILEKSGLRVSGEGEGKAASASAN